MLKSKPPVIIAHRGASKAKRENTLEAFETALEMGADGIEFDVRRTKDGVFVVHHDVSVQNVATPLSQMTYSEADRASTRAGFHIPTLEEVLDRFGQRAVLDIELKEQDYEGDVIAFLRERTDGANIVITSFNDETIRRTKSAWPQVRAGLILGVDPPTSIGVRISELLPKNRLRRCGADFVAPHARLLKIGFMRRMRKADFPVWVWTVDDADLAQTLTDQGVAAIITNSPEVIRAAIQ